jgi:hypothetical protein
MSYQDSDNKLYNRSNGLHNLDDSADIYRLNYLFLKQLPMYVRLEQKYKELKRRVREQDKMIELLNKQYFETVEKFSLHPCFRFQAKYDNSNQNNFMYRIVSKLLFVYHRLNNIGPASIRI